MSRTAGAVVAVATALLLAVAGCGGSEPGPATGAARVVPATALAYVNVSLDPGRPAVARALRLARRLPGFPLLVPALEARLAAAAGVGTGADWGWVGREGALALLRDSRNRADALAVLSVRDARGFRRFAAAAAAGAVAAAGGFALIGSPAVVAQAEAVAHGRAPSLASLPAYRRAAATEPAGRVLDAWVPGPAVTPLLGGRGGLLGALGVFLAQPSLQGVSVSLSAPPGGARLMLHSVLAPRRPPFAAGATLQRVVPSGAALMIDLASLRRSAPRLLRAGAVAGIGGQLQPLLTRLGAALRSEGVDVGRLESLFDHEAAIAVTSAGRPGLLVLVRAPDPARARLLLAGVEPSLASLFPTPASGPGTTPVFADHQIAGVDVHSLQLAPGLQLDYAVLDHLIALSTSTQAIVSVIRRGRSLAEDRGFRAALGDTGALAARDTSLVFADLTQLVRLGRQFGLVRATGSGLLGSDLARIRFAGARTAGGRDESTAELLLSIP